MLIVQKYGGTSVGTIERMENVAKRCLAAQRNGHKVAVVVSAMSGETNRLLKLVDQVHDDHTTKVSFPSPSESLSPLTSLR